MYLNIVYEQKQEELQWISRENVLSMESAGTLGHSIKT